MIKQKEYTRDVLFRHPYYWEGKQLYFMVSLLKDNQNLLYSLADMYLTSKPISILFVCFVFDTGLGTSGCQSGYKPVCISSLKSK